MCTRAPFFLFGGFASVLALTACGSNTAPVEDVPEFDGDCSKVTAPPFAELSSGLLVPYCVECHDSMKTGGARNGATPTINFDSFDATKAAAFPAIAAVKGRLMPSPDGEGPTNADRNLLYEWALCGMPP